MYSLVSYQILLFVEMLETLLFCLVSSILAIQIYQITATRRVAHHLIRTDTSSARGVPTKPCPKVSRSGSKGCVVIKGSRNWIQVQMLCTLGHS